MAAILSAKAACWPPADRARRALCHGQFRRLGPSRQDLADGLGKQLPELDRGFSALLDDMHERGLLADTLVLAFGEFGRSPKINKDVGRDHWGTGGVAAVRRRRRPRRTGSRPNRQARRLRDAPSGGAGGRGLHRLRGTGHRPAQGAGHPDGRPNEILDKGETVKELYA